MARGSRARGEATRLQAIVVGHVDLGERDRILRLLCAEHGRLSAVARGLRGSTRRFGGSLDTGNKVELVLHPGRDELWTIDEAQLIDGRSGVRQDLVRLTLLAHVCELCAALAREGQAEPRLYGLLDMAATLLDAMTAPPGRAFRVAVEAKALSFAGLAPSLDRCPACGQAPADPMCFLVDRGGGVHLHCGAGGPPVDAAWLQAVERARRTPLKELVDAKLPPGPDQVLAEMIEAHSHRELRARRVLQALEPRTPG